MLIESETEFQYYRYNKVYSPTLINKLFETYKMRKIIYYHLKKTVARNEKNKIKLMI